MAIAITDELLVSITRRAYWLRERARLTVLMHEMMRGERRRNDEEIRRYNEACRMAAGMEIPRRIGE